MAAKQIRPCLQLVFFSSLLLFPCVLAFSMETLKYSSKIIKEINSKGPYIGLISVYAAEENAFFASNEFTPDSTYPYVDLSGRRFRIGETQWKKIIYVRSGVGLVNAAAATQQLLDFFDVTGIIHFGISGNTNSSLNIGDVIIPKQFVNTGLWDWLKPKATIPSNDFAKLEIKDYNVPKEGSNSLGRIGYSPEEFYSKEGESDTPQQVVWFNVFDRWLQIASKLKEIELERCVNASVCLENKPKVVIGHKASTANIFVDNADYRDFLYQTFGVSSADMESTAVIMTSLSNGYPVIVISGLSNLAGAEDGQNSNNLYEPLAAANVVKAVVRFIFLLFKYKSI